MWGCLHWQFTFFYLEMACLFRLTFQLNSDEDFEKLQARKKKLSYVHIAGYLTIVAISVFVISIYEFVLEFKPAILSSSQLSIQSLVNLTFTLVTILSMRHVSKQSKSI